jgi:hypothetical protein
MKISLRLSLSVLALGLPVLTLAAPNNVTGLAAAVEAGGVRVTWDKVEGDIATYRVFYSHASILNNAGLYDDFEEVSGEENTHLLRNIPAASELYVSVLAVDRSGVESPYFTEEAHVTLASGPAMPASSAMTEPMSSMPTQAVSSATAMSSVDGMQADDMLRLLSIDVVSSTGVVLHFSHMVTVDPARATEAVTIETASGTKLAMKRLMIQGYDIHIDTAEQERGIAYKVTVGTAVSAIGSEGQKLFVSPDDAPVLFSGHPTGTMPSSSASSTGTSAQRSEVTQLRLRAQPTDKTYRVETTWQPASGDVKGYSIAQTTDGGKTYRNARTVGPESRDIIVSGVPAGSFGMLIKVIYSDNTVSQGITQTIDLPHVGGTPIAGSVTGGSTALPNSGPALWVAIAVTGAAAGYLQDRRKKMAVQVA